MKKLTRCSVFAMAAAFLLTATTPAQQKDAASASKKAASGTIEGLVRDIACPIQVKEATATRFNMECVLQCAKGGSPLIILTKDGLIYTPISDAMPDKDQRQRLEPFVGKYVKAGGEIFERGGARAIAITEITEMKDVPLITDAK